MKRGGEDKRKKEGKSGNGDNISKRRFGREVPEAYVIVALLFALAANLTGYGEVFGIMVFVVIVIAFMNVHQKERGQNLGTKIVLVIAGTLLLMEITRWEFVPMTWLIGLMLVIVILSGIVWGNDSNRKVEEAMR